MFRKTSNAAGQNKQHMSMNSQQTQLLMSALGAAANIAGTVAQVEHGRTKLRALEVEILQRERTLETQLSHEREMFGMKAGLMRDIIHALIDRRVDAVQQGFRDTLTMYAEQCRHYMAQQDRYADAEIKATAPLERATIRARLSDIDVQLNSIRSDAAGLYREMTKVILLIGGAMPAMSNQDQRALVLMPG
jgi:hypothetical protein